MLYIKIFGTEGNKVRDNIEEELCSYLKKPLPGHHLSFNQICICFIDGRTTGNMVIVETSSTSFADKSGQAIDEITKGIGNIIKNEVDNDNVRVLVPKALQQVN